MKTPFIFLMLGVSVLLLSALTVSADHPLTLEFSEDSVMTGSDVTLKCKRTKGDYVEAYFYFNETKLHSNPQLTFTIHKVQQSHEGFYSCSTNRYGKTPEKRLRVKDPPSTSAPLTTTVPTTTTVSTTTTDLRSVSTTDNSVTPPSSSPIIIVISVLGSLVALVLLVVGLVHLWRKPKAKNGLSPEEDVTYADVTIRQKVDKVPVNVTYDQVVMKNVKKSGRRTEPSEDVTYSTVRAGI